MTKVVYLIIVLVILNTFMVCVGNVMEIFNHPEGNPSDKRPELREDIEKSGYYPTDDQIMDDLYTSLDVDDYKNGPYSFNKPDFKTRLLDALSRIKYVDGSPKSRRQVNDDQFKTYQQFNQTPYNDINNYVPDGSFNSKEKLLKRNTGESVTSRNSLENLLYDEFYKSPNNNPLLVKFPHNDPEIPQNIADVRPRNDPRNNKLTDQQFSFNDILKDEMDINNSIALLSSILKYKKDEKIKARQCPKEPSEYDSKYKRDLPDTDNLNSDSSDLNKMEENIMGLNDRNDKLKDAINEISDDDAVVIDESKHYIHSVTENSDTTSEPNIFLDNKENSEINDDKETDGNIVETVSSDDNLHDDKILEVDHSVDESTEENEIVEREPKVKLNKKHSKLKHRHVDRHYVNRDNEKFRKHRREEEAAKNIDNRTDIVKIITTESVINEITNNIINTDNIVNISSVYVTNFYAYSYNNVSLSTIIDLSNTTANIITNINVQDKPQVEKQVEKAKVLISNPLNAIVQQPSQIATQVTVHNMIENSTIADTAMVLPATRTGKGRLLHGGEMSYAVGSAYEGRATSLTTTNSRGRNITTEKCLAITTKKPNITDELKIAKQINDYVRNLLVHASKTSMRKELGLCKTYDKAYTSVKSNQNGMEDEIMKGMIGCMSKILSGSIKPTLCGEMPNELLQFLDWLLLNGVSARDEFKQYMVNGGPQRKSFLFAKNENTSSSSDRCDATTKLEFQCATKSVLDRNMVSGRNDSANSSSSLYSNLKKTILSGLSPYLKYNTNNQDINRMYPFGNTHVISNRNVKIPQPNVYNRYKFLPPLIDPEPYRIYPYYRPAKERWAKSNKFADEMLNGNPYEDVYLPRSKLNYPHMFNLYRKLPHDQSVGAVGDDDLTQFDNSLGEKQVADFDGLG